MVEDFRWAPTVASLERSGALSTGSQPEVIAMRQFIALILNEEGSNYGVSFPIFPAA